MSAVLEKVVLDKSVSNPIDLIQIRFELGLSLEKYIDKIGCGINFFNACLTEDKIKFEAKSGFMEIDLKIVPFKQKTLKNLLKRESNFSDIPWEVGFEILNKFSSLFSKDKEYVLFTEHCMFMYGAYPRLVSYTFVEKELKNYMNSNKQIWLIC